MVELPGPSSGTQEAVSPESEASSVGWRERLKSRAIRGSAWTVVGFGTNQVLRLCSNVILTRLLTPDDFGMMAIVSIFMQGLQMFSDVGIGPSIVQNERGDDPAFLNTAWTIQVVRGVVLWGVMLAIAWPIAVVYQKPQLFSLLIVVGSTSMIGGLTSTAMFSLERHVKIGPRVAFDVSSQVIALAFMITVAWITHSVWALALGAVLWALVRLVLSHTLIPGTRPRLGWDKTAARSLYHFGRWIFLSTVCTFLAMYGDQLFVPFVAGFGGLGVYHMAVTFSRAIQKVQNRLSNFVIFPAFSQIARQDNATLRSVLYKVRLRADALFLPASGVLLMTGDSIIKILLNVRFHEAGWMLELLIIQTSMAYIINPGEAALLARGKPKYRFFHYLSRLVWIAVAIPFGWHLGELRGLVWAVVLSEIPGLVIIWWGMRRNQLFSLSGELRGFLLFGCGIPVGWLLELLLKALR